MFFITRNEAAFTYQSAFTEHLSSKEGGKPESIHASLKN